MKQIFSILCLTALFAVITVSCGDDDNKELEQFTVTFDSQDGSKVASQTISYGEKVVEPTRPTKEGHAFIGWYTETSYTHEWNFESDIVIKDITLYARWTIAEYTVTFNTNGGSEVKSQPVAKGSKVQRPLPPTKDGYIFDNWYTDIALTQVYDFDTQVTGNLTLYANWIKAESITKELLLALIEEADAINPSKYSEASMSNLYNKMQDARVVADNVNASAQEIEDAYQALKQAIFELVEVPYRATVNINYYPESKDDIILINIASVNPFYLHASGVDDNGKESTNNGVTFEYNGLEGWAKGDIEVYENELSFTVNPALTAGKTIQITIKSTEFPTVSKTVTLKTAGANEIKTLYINAVNALPSPNQITIDNYEAVSKALEYASELYYSLSEEDKLTSEVQAAYKKYEEVLIAIEKTTIISYSFEGNLCKFKSYGEILYAEYISKGNFPVGDYIMKDWDYDSKENKYYNEILVLEQNNKFTLYIRTSDNADGSNPSNREYDGSGTYTYTGTKDTGGKLIMIHNEEDSQYTLKTKYHFKNISR